MSMKAAVRTLALCAMGLVLTAPALVGQESAPAAQAASGRPMHIYIRAGLKTHPPGMHDYPQFLADWSKLLTDHGAIVDGSLHFPTPAELSGVNVMVMYKGDAGYMTPTEQATLEDYLARGGGLVSIHDTLCGPDPEWLASILGGAKKHGETNFSAGDIKYSIVNKASPIMQGMSDFTLNDEAFFLMTFAKSPAIHVLATGVIPESQSAGTHAGEVVPQVWTYENRLLGGGVAGQPYRAFVWMQGHAYANFTNPVIEPMLLRGIAWAADYPVDALMAERPARGGGGGRGRGGRGGRGAGGRAGAPAGAAGGGRGGM